MIRNLKRTAEELSQSSKRKIMNLEAKTKILDPPIKSLSDKKEYRLIQLPNGLKSLLIQHFIDDDEEDDADNSQKSTEIDDKSEGESSQGSGGESEEGSEEEDEKSSGQKLAAVALCVNVGSFSDLPEVQGLSHFLEHMIFMGSEKYPKENDYDQFISNNGGFNNAHTECEYTLFQFEIVDDHLSKAMDIFSQLFISPLMLREGMQREMQAVESEFQNNLNDDDCRIQQLCASLANGPASTFTWGNIKTLKDRIDNEKLYELVHEFRKKFYIANRMYLCVESKMSLDELQKLIEDHFSAIVSAPEPVPFEVPAVHFKKEFFEKVYYVKPKADKIKLYLTFQLPSMEEHYRSKPHDYVAYLIQHEGEGSLSSYLKKKLLALNVEAGTDDQSFEGNSMFSLFSIVVTLTEEGYANLESVLEAIFSYLLLLKTTSIEDHHVRFEEMRKIKKTQFDYSEEKSPTDNVESLAVYMNFYKNQDIIRGSDVYIDYDPIMIQKVIAELNQLKFNLLILTDKYEKFEKTEEWFGTEYQSIGM